MTIADFIITSLTGDELNGVIAAIGTLIVSLHFRRKHLYPKSKQEDVLCESFVFASNRKLSEFDGHHWTFNLPFYDKLVSIVVILIIIFIII